jgi:SAM-dependent methyltransferase
VAVASIDWSNGHYESTAEMLLPVSAVAVDAADIRPSLRVLDIGSGTGNAAMLAAQRGADVVAVEPAERLREVARERVASAGLTVDVRAGTAAAMPIDDASIDVALSVFAVIFAPEPAEAAAEIARVLTPAGRLVMTAWTPSGAFADVFRLEAQIMREALGTPESPPPFAWHEESAVAELFKPHGFTVHSAQHPIPFAAATPEACYDMGQDNPVGLAVRQALEAAGRHDQVERLRTEGVALLRKHNEDSTTCRVTSHYALHVIART